jgi:hypothetical protein
MADKIQIRGQIKAILSSLHPSEAIGIIESIGKEIRRKNSIRINNRIDHKSVHLIDDDRPDLGYLKSKL